MIATGKNRIMIFGPKADGTYVVEFRTAECRKCRPGKRQAADINPLEPVYSSAPSWLNASPHEIRQTTLARLMLALRQSAAK
jgi:hypothetical protein